MLYYLLDKIFEKTYDVVLISLNGDDMYRENFHTYLLNKYKQLLEDLLLEENDTTIQSIVDSYIEDELRILGNISKSELLSILDKDFAFEHLMFLSEIAFSEAKKCISTGVYLTNADEYKVKLEELANCLDDIKPHNIEVAKELLSESILDIDFIFKKSDVKSLRLAKTI